MALTDTFNRIPTLIKWAVGIGLAIILLIAFFQFGGSLSNGIGNWLFRRQINAKQAEVQKQLDDAAEQKKALEQTMREFAAAKQELETVKAEKDRLEKIFNDQSRTASEKVAEFKKAVSDDPQFTPTDGVTFSALCERAKATRASPATVAALCR